MKKPVINLDKNWTRLVWAMKRLSRTPPVTTDRTPVHVTTADASNG